MFRKNFKDNFALRFIFEDIDSIPVSLKDIDVDFWISTRSNAPAFSAFVRKKAAFNAKTLDDGSIIVFVSNHRLPPGKVKASVNVIAEALCTDNKRNEHHHHHGKCPEFITIEPNVPLELVDSNVIHSCADHNQGNEPIIVKCRFNVSRPQLQQHVTRNELNKALEEALKDIGVEPAESEDISDILKLFDVNDVESV